MVAAYVTQSLAGLAWWIAVAANRGIHDWFAALPEERSVLLSFLPVDVVLWIGGGLATAVLLRQHHRWALMLALSLAAVTIYVAGYLLVLSAVTRSGWPAAIAMSTSAVLMGYLARAVSRLCTVEP